MKNACFASKTLKARLDRSLGARVLSSRPLLYDAGPEPGADQPAHVRAGSSLAWVGGRLALVQDDALFLGLLDPRAGTLRALALPAASDGVRCFDDVRGNKEKKADFEACAVTRGMLLAFGSGSSPARERILLVRGLDAPDSAGARPEVEVIDGRRLYQALRAETRFSGSELNIEGAVARGESLVLFQRGNGAPREGLRPMDATCELSLPELMCFLNSGGASDPPPVNAIVQYDLGALEGVRLTFTDAMLLGDELLYLAAAEASPDAVRDGPVAGVALGILSAEEDGVRYTILRDESGRPFSGKAEGLAYIPEDPRYLYLVVDRDNPNIPAELCTVEIQGFS